VQAGLPVVHLQRELASAGQWLALDPPEESATVGGVVAANASGPRRHRYGTVRDLLIGATFVLADGTVAKTGGKVVKNVAGYDLAKLMTGSYGTLAILADVTFRLHPRPATTSVVRTEVDSIGAAADAAAAYRRSKLEPSALELRMNLPGESGVLTALFEGHERTALSQAQAATVLIPGSTSDDVLEPDFAAHPWSATGSSDSAAERIGLRIAYPPAELAHVLRAVREVVRDVGGAQVRGRAGVGVLELGLAPEATTDFARVLELLRLATLELGANLVVVAAPVVVKAGIDCWGPTAGLDIMRRVKDRFDPQHRLSPGRFVGGI
jgi:glycolate oxidase FAD binding subunit